MKRFLKSSAKDKWEPGGTSKLRSGIQAQNSRREQRAKLSNILVPEMRVCAREIERASRERERERGREAIARKGDQQKPRSTYGRLQVPQVRPPPQSHGSLDHINPSLAGLIVNTPQTILQS